MSQLTVFLKRLILFYESAFPQKESKLLNDASFFWNNNNKKNKAKIQDLSHWKDSGRWTDGNWEKIGNAHFDMFLKLRAMCEFHGPLKRMVEWGPGGGANVRVFSEIFKEIIGVDISDENLCECEKQLSGIHNIQFQKILIDITNPEAVLDSITSKIDFFLSTAVFQHFTGKSYGERIMKIASSLLRKGGLSLIQIRYDDGDPAVATKKRSYKRNAIKFTSYHIHEFWNTSQASGFQPITVILKPNVQYAYYFLRKE